MPGIGENPTTASAAASAAFPPMAAVSAAEGTLNALMGHFQNVKNRKFAREQYKQQRQDNLADWATANEYNSPKAQMQRYRDAGLNPNLIYGQMQTATPIKGASQQGASGNAPSTGGEISRGILQQYDLRKRQADTDLQSANLELMTWTKKEMESRTFANYKSAGLSDAETQNKMYDLRFKQDTRPTTIAQMEANLDKTLAEITKIGADTKYTLDQNDRATAANSQSIAESVERILKSKAERSKIPTEIAHLNQMITNLKTDNRLKLLDEGLKTKGIQPHDAAWQRWVQDAMQYIIGQATKQGTGGKVITHDSSHKPKFNATDSQ
jgi:hypothetical protein